MTRVFISYNRESQPFAENLRNQLLKWGYETWMDVYDIPPDCDWREEIVRCLKASDIILGVVTELAIKSDYVKYEWSAALIYEKPLILIGLELCDLPSMFGLRQVLDFVKNEKAGWQALKAGLELAKYNDPEMFRKPTNPLPSVKVYLNDKIAHFRQLDKDSFVSMKFTISDTRLKDDHTSFTDPLSIYKQHRQFVLLGLPGVGKSMILRTLFKEIAQAHLKDGREPMPLWIDLNDPENPEEALELFERWCSTYTLERSFKYMVNTKCPVIFLDGLNEMPLESRSKRAESIAKWLALKPEARVIVGCRARDYEDDRDLYLGTNIAKIVVQPFEMNDIRRFLQKNISIHDRSRKLISYIEKDDAIFRLAQIPLHLNMLAQLSMWQIDHARPPDRLKTLYQEFLKTRHAYEKRRNPNLLEWNNIEAKMGKLAYSLISPDSKAKEGAFSASEAKVKRSIGANALQNAYDLRFLVCVIDNNKRELFGSPRRRVQFSHQSLHGYFALPRLNAALAQLNRPRFFPFTSGNLATIIRQIGDLGDTAELAVDSLIPLLSHTSQAIRTATENALIDIGIPSIAPLIKDLLNENQQVRSSVIKILKEIGEPVKGPLLVHVLHHDNPDIHEQVGMILSGMRGIPFELTQALMNTMENRDDFRVYVAQALGKIRSSRAMQSLIMMLKDDDFWVRADIAWALGRIGDKIAIPPLIELLKMEIQPNALVYADDAIRQLGAEAIRLLIKALQEQDSVKYENILRALSARLTSDDKTRDQAVLEKIVKIVRANKMSHPFLKKAIRFYSKNL